jgi:hypothetical protein
LLTTVIMVGCLTIQAAITSQRCQQRARWKAAALGLSHVEFRTGDLANTGLPSGSFDAVVCVFGSSS